MGRKKKKASKPWCWYCNREFDDEKILVQHQKAKHFKCHICHKKLYTGPGLSIHCMQVHKESIDKVPNSLPNRSNIEIEIFGMDGIPPEDLKDHERQKNGGRSDSEDDEPVGKKIKTEAPTVQSPGMMMPNMLTQLCQFTPMGPMGPMTPMGPMPPYMNPAGMQLMPPHMMGAPPRPLFPAGAVATSAMQSQAKPTFPAYSNATISAPPTTNNPSAQTASANSADAQNKPLITTTGTTSKIMHPPEDLSLEEIRARKSKYQRKTPTTSSASSSVSTTSHTPTSSYQTVSSSMVQSSYAPPTSTITSTAYSQAHQDMRYSQASQMQHAAAMAAVVQAQAQAHAVQAAAQQQQQQKQFDDINRAVMLQRLQAARQPGPPLGMVPMGSTQMQLMQPMMRPAMALAPHGALIGGNMLRHGPPGMGGMPTGILTPMPGMVAPGMGVMIPGPHMGMMMQPRFR